MNTVEIETDVNTVDVELIPVETIQYGFMGLQSYEGVESVVDH